MLYLTDKVCCGLMRAMKRFAYRVLVDQTIVYITFIRRFSTQDVYEGLRQRANGNKVKTVVFHCEVPDGYELDADGKLFAVPDHI